MNKMEHQYFEYFPFKYFYNSPTAIQKRYLIHLDYLKIVRSIIYTPHNFNHLKQLYY